MIWMYPYELQYIKKFIFKFNFVKEFYDLVDNKEF